MNEDVSGKSLPNSGMAIAGLVLGILALVSSWIPIINNLSFFIGLIGALLAILGLVGVLRGKRGGKGLAIAAVAVNVVSIAVVLVTQSAYSSALDKATSAPEATAVSSIAPSDDAAKMDGGQKDDSADAKVDTSALALGSSVQLDNGVTVSVDSVTPGLVNYDDSAVTGVQVTLTNNGSENMDFSEYHWKCENANGVQTDITYYSDAENEMNSGTLSAGGTITAMLYFEGDITKVHYYGNMFADSPSATWVLS